MFIKKMYEVRFIHTNMSFVPGLGLGHTFSTSNSGLGTAGEDTIRRDVQPRPS